MRDRLPHLGLTIDARAADLSTHRTRTNRRPDPPLHPGTVAEIEQVMDDIVQDRD